MTLLEQIKDLAPLLDKPGQSDLVVAGKLLGIVAATQEPETEVTVEMFELLGPAGRRIAMQGVCLILLNVMNEK